MKFKVFEDNTKLVTEFGAKKIDGIKLPDFYTFSNGLVYSHRDFDKFFSRLIKGEKSAIVSGVNASGTFHIGHKAVFDTNLFFQKKYGVEVFVPISDDESYVSGKINSQEEALKNSLKLAREVLALGFDPNKTHFIIDQIYTKIYNLAIRLSKKVTLSEVRATYGYRSEDNIGLHFYPAVQAAHVLFPAIERGIKNVLVPIGPDEDAHLRIARDIASRIGERKPAVLHLVFVPGLDGEKMSKSKNNAIFLNDDEKTLRKKCNKAFSGGKKTIEEHRKYGGNPEVDIPFRYLSSYFLTEDDSKKIAEKYKKGEMLSGEMKDLLFDKLKDYLKNFQKNVSKIKKSDLEKSILR
ncbi:MAG: tryptophan--tRNA ligase [Candidatus Schekmanbacteria bacterium]|nr:MAG: tryptophan--tRNA ligase [Candidatus Schekmanbacteria bacterium]